MSEKTTRTCRRCGAPLPEGAAFCPVCTASQVERQILPMPRRRRRVWPVAAGCLMLAALALFFVLHRPAAEPVEPAADQPSPQETDPYLTACQTYYTAADGREYHVFAAFSPQGEGGDDTVPVGYHAELVPEGMQPSCPATVFVTDALTGANANAAFSTLMEDSGVTVSAADGIGRVQLQEPDYDWADTGALLFRVMVGDSSCAHNEIVWTLRMKNGDAIELRQTAEFTLQQTVTFRWEDTPMSTAAELQALLDDIARRYDADTKVQLQLPTVTYDAPLQITCPVELLGSGTVFAAPVTVASLTGTERSGAHARFRDVTFAAADGGTGLSAAAPVYLERCRFTGWDVAAQAVDGGWVYSQSGSTFSGNSTALRFSVAYTDSFGFPSDTEFSDNDVAVQVERLPDGVWLRLENCRFLRNGTDISNPRQYRVETDASYFE